MRKIISPCGFHCIKVNHLGVWFSEQEILKDVNLHMHCGSLNAIIGKNGAGKSTLIRAMLGDIPHTGDIEFRDTKDGRMQNLKIRDAIRIFRHRFFPINGLFSDPQCI